MSKTSLSVVVASALLASSVTFALDNANCGPRVHRMPPKIATTEEVKTNNQLAIEDESIMERMERAFLLDDEQKALSTNDDYLGGDSGEEKLADSDEPLEARIVRRPAAIISRDPKVDTVVVPSKTCRCIKAPCHCPSETPMEE